MSPASKSKSKDKSAAKAAKEQPKASSKPSAAPVNGGNGITTSAYNPLSGTFHSLETGSSTALSSPQSNGRFRNIDETDDHSGTSLGTAADFDSISNNDSCSGESEDQQKDKTAASTSRTEPIPGSDIDKREKVRLKNEKKHQRQRERRAQELHERCCSYLTSRKLEWLAQKLVAMGFTSEQATMALIQNEGRIEESALWLLEGTEESKHLCASSIGANPKIDITDELARITDLEVSFKCTKQEVERAVVACEGDLDKAEESLKAQKQESAVTPKSEDSFGDQPIVSSNGFHNSRPAATSSPNNVNRTQVKGASPATVVQLQRRDERDFNYTKLTTPSVAAAAQTEAASRISQPSLRKVQSKPADWMKTQAAVPPVDKRWPSTSSSPTTPYSLASPLQVSAAQLKPEARYVATSGSGSEVKTSLLSGTLREPIFMMQRPQSNGTRQNVTVSSASLGASPPASNGWYPTGSNGTSSMDAMKLANGGLGQQLRKMSLAGSNSSHHQFYPQSSIHQQFISAPSSSSSSSPVVESGGSGWSGTYRSPPSSSPLAVPSSLGLFTGWGYSSVPSGSSPPVDWSTRGLMPQCDYTSIDWSLDSTPLTLPSSSMKAERLYDNSWHSSSKAAARPAGNGGGVCVSGLQDGSLMVNHPAPAAGSHEWTSPFAGKDLFRVPRQYVTSPSP